MSHVVELYKRRHLLCDWESRLASSLASLESALEGKLSWNALHTMCRVDVLDEGDLVARRTTLARGDNTVGKEVFPDLGNC